MKYKGFNVTVNTFIPQNGSGVAKSEALIEYHPKHPLQNNTMSTYIASRAGQQFSIKVENETEDSASVVFFVDGQMASCLLCYARPLNNEVVCYGVQPQEGILRKFMFKKATLTGISPSHECVDL
jgi:hypothetical protein